MLLDSEGTYSQGSSLCAVLTLALVAFSSLVNVDIDIENYTRISHFQQVCLHELFHGIHFRTCTVNFHKRSNN